MESTENVEVQVTETAPVVTPEVGNDAATAGQTAVTQEAVPEVPQYTPNYKFKAMKEEKEIDEWARPLIKDADSEKKVREIWEKAYGLDHFKSKFEGTSQERDQYKQAYQGIFGDAQQLFKARDAGDMETVFKKIGMSPEKVYQWVWEKAQRQNLPPEQRQMYDELDQKKQREWQLASQNEELTQNYQQMASQARAAEVDFVLARPEIYETRKRYDDTNGEGSFRQLVARFGVMHHMQNGQDAPAEQIVDAVMKTLGDPWRGQSAQPVIPQNNVEKPLPVIPNVSGKNVSPTRKSPRSIDDLKKLAEEATG